MCVICLTYIGQIKDRAGNHEPLETGAPASSPTNVHHTMDFEKENICKRIHG